MKIYILIYIGMWILEKLITPFVFGTKKTNDEINAEEWLISIVIELPIIYFLINYLLNV